MCICVNFKPIKLLFLFSFALYLVQHELYEAFFLEVSSENNSPSLSQSAVLFKFLKSQKNQFRERYKSELSLFY
jgi:hypothetical protein